MLRNTINLGFCFTLLSVGSMACNAPTKPSDTPPVTDTIQADTDTTAMETVLDSSWIETDTLPLPTAPDTVIGDLEQRMIDAGLVKVTNLDTTIVTDLRYSTESNFLNIDLYGDFNAIYLQQEVAEKLVLASKLLRSKYPYRIVVFDAVRPRSVQQAMWDVLDLPLKEKTKYVSNPRYGSLHNFGAAVDVSIMDQYGDLLDMGTGYDHFGELAYPSKEEELLESGELKLEQIQNRQLLRSVMYKAGFTNIHTEWWHFNSCSRKEARERFPIIE